MKLEGRGADRGAAVGRAQAPGAARPVADPRGQHGRGRDEGLREAAGRGGRRLQGGGEAVRGHAHRGPLAHGGREGAHGHQAHGRGAEPAQKVADNHSTTVTVSGPDKELVGEIAAEIRGIRPPEPYKGKGIRYLTEKVRRKAGKTGTGAK